MSKENKKPNILFLFSDQHSAQALGCYGNSEVYTPHLDNLAEQGIKFSNAYCNNPICTPSRMCFLSGQYAHNHNYWGLMGPDPEWLPNIFGYLKQFGYNTGWFGKSHTPAGWLTRNCDEFKDGMGYEKRITQKDFNLLEGLQGRKDDDYSKYLQGIGLSSLREDKILSEQFKQFGYNNGQGIDAKSTEMPVDNTIEAWSAHEAGKFIKSSVEKGKPFMCWMTVPKPHQVYGPSKEFWDMYQTDKLTLPPNADDSLKGRHLTVTNAAEFYRKDESWRLFEPKDWDSSRRRVLHGYYANVTQMDDAVGRIISVIDNLDIRENTIIIYTTDHGEFAGEHGMIEKAPGISFRCITRIPFIISWDGVIPKGEEREGIIESVDLLPTVCSLAGIPEPDWVDGKKFSSMIEIDQDLKEYAVTEHPWSKTIQTKEYKLTQYLPEMCNGKEFGELYNMRTDPWEMNNLYFDKGLKSTVSNLQMKLYYWLVQTSRHKTISPAPMVYKGDDYGTWDLAQHLYDRDGRLGMNYIKHVLSGKSKKHAVKTSPLNYL